MGEISGGELLLGSLHAGAEVTRRGRSDVVTKGRVRARMEDILVARYPTLQPVA